MRKRFINWLRRVEGLAMSEYGLLLALMTIFGAVALLLLGPKLREVIEEISTYLELRV